MASATDEILATIEFAARHGLSHFRAETGRLQVELWREAAVGQAGGMPTGGTAPQTPATAQPDPAGIVVQAPVAGICHLTPEPGQPPFVTVGDVVTAGQTLCLIEAMKVMTAIPAPKAGTVLAIPVTAGASVPLGAPLIEITP